MYPASESSGLYQLADGSINVQMNFRIVSEPTYIANADLAYPYAGTAVSFNQDESYLNLSALDKIQITYQSDGVIRMAILDSMTLADGNEGGEPGYTLHPSETDTTIEISLSDANFSTNFTVPSWTGGGNSRDDVLKAVRGFKFEGKMQKGGYGSLTLKDFKMYDISGQPMNFDPSGIQNSTAPKNHLNFSLSGSTIAYSNLSNHAILRIFDLNGNLISKNRLSGSGTFHLQQALPSRGIFIAQLQDRGMVKSIKINR